jgi:hypothetical protein
LAELAFRPLVSLGLRSLVVTIGGSAAAAGVAAGLGLALGGDPSRVELIGRMAAVGIVWLLTSAAIATVLRITELRSMIDLMLDLLRRRRPA